MDNTLDEEVENTLKVIEKDLKTYKRLAIIATIFLYIAIFAIILIENEELLKFIIQQFK